MADNLKKVDESEKTISADKSSEREETTTQTESEKQGLIKNDDELISAENTSTEEVEKSNKSNIDENENPEKTKNSILSKLKTIDNKEQANSSTSKFDDNSDGYISAREAINALDEEIKVESKDDEEVIAKEVKNQLEKQAEYFVIRIRKSVFMLFMGIIVLILWLAPLTIFLQNKYGFKVVDYIPWLNIKQEKIDTNTTIDMVVENPVLVRIKAASENEGLTDLVNHLKRNSFDNVDVELALVESKGVSVAVKQNSQELLNKILTLISQKYEATASSTILSEDSDFDAVVMIGSD